MHSAVCYRQPRLSQTGADAQHLAIRLTKITMSYKALTLGTLTALASVFYGDLALADPLEDLSLDVSGETTINGITARMTQGINPDNTAGTLGAFSEFYGDKTATIDFNSAATPVGENRYTFGNELATYTFDQAIKTVPGKATGVFNNRWAPTGANGEKNTSDYLAVFQGNSVTIDLAEELNYFGLGWGAISVGNQVSFWQDSTPVSTFTYEDVNPLAPIKSDHQKNEGNGYLHFYASDQNSTFDRIVIAQLDKGGIETDNHSFHVGDDAFDFDQETEDPESVPEPTAMLGLVAVGAVMFSRKK